MLLGCDSFPKMMKNKKNKNHLSLPGHRVNVDLLGLGDELAEFGKKQLFFP